MPPEHDATAIQHHSIPGKINWLALHASVFRRNSASKKKRYLGVCLVAQVQWRTSCSLTIFGRFRWAAATYSELPVVSEEYLAPGWTWRTCESPPCHEPTAAAATGSNRWV